MRWLIDLKATARNRLHRNDLEACVKKCCYFWLNSEVHLDLVILPYLNAISIDYKIVSSTFILCYPNVWDCFIYIYIVFYPNVWEWKNADIKLLNVFIIQMIFMYLFMYRKGVHLLKCKS